MTLEQIRETIPEMETTMDLLILLNRVKKDVYGDKCHPFSLKLLNYYCSPARAVKAWAHFKIPKKSGGFREISAPTKSLKSILTCLNVVFQALHEPSIVAKGFLPEMSIVDNATPHVGMLYVFNTDLKDFFPSVDMGRVWTVLQLPQYGFKKDVARMIASLCCMRIVDKSTSEEKKKKYRYVLPQGAPTSPILTNMVCQTLDRRLNGIAKRFNLHCTRYADDISFSGMYNVFQKNGEFRAELQRVIEDQGFKMNLKKTRLQKKGERQKVTGLTVCNKVNVSREYVRELQSILFIWEKYGREAAVARFSLHYHSTHPTSKRIAQDIMERVLLGKLMYLRMVKGENDKVFNRLFYRFVALCPPSAKDVSAYQYDLAYKISEFEAEYETTVQFKLRIGAEQIGSEEKPYAVMRMNNRNVFIMISRKCAPLVIEALSSDDTECLMDLRDRLYIVLCKKQGKKPFWMIMKSNPKNILKSETPRNVDLAMLLDVTQAESHSQEDNEEPAGKETNIDNILSEFIKSNFDLSILDKWDKTNNS